MLRLLPITALILAGALTVARADVYRWIDEHGEPHYSDEWVPGSVIIKTIKPHPSSFTSTARTAGSNTRVPTDLNDQANAKAVQQDVAKTRDVQCKAAKDRYTKSVQSRRVFKVNKDGAREVLSDEAADAYREQARKDVQDLCGSVPAFTPDQPVPEPQPIPEPKVNPAEATSP